MVRWGVEGARRKGGVKMARIWARDIVRKRARREVGGEDAAMREAEALAAKGVRRFTSDASLLDAARVLFALREYRSESCPGEALKDVAALDRRLTRAFHAAVAASPAKLHLVRLAGARRLSCTEREVALLLALSAMGLTGGVDDVRDVQKCVGTDGRRGIAVARALRPGSRLAARKLVEVEYDEDTDRTEIRAGDRLVEPLVSGDEVPDKAWRVRSYDELLDRMFEVFGALAMNAENLESVVHMRYRGRRRYRHASRSPADRLMEVLEATAKKHPAWPIRRLTGASLGDDEKKVLVVLAGKELGWQQPDSPLFTGDGLARAVSSAVPEVRHALGLLRRDRALRSGNCVRICGGNEDSGAVEDDATLRACEFELTDEFRDAMKLERRRRSKNVSRRPVVRMSQLVLPDGVRRALDMVAAQMRHAKILMDDWGLAKAVPYGRAVTALFWGPPGTGKTASAEAIAHELGRPIIVASYARIQDCWVGQTEKNIARIFRDAAEDGAVLFWDEADAMFFDRDSASRNWEVRDVNVLLQELERFPGLCILATNRRLTLDKALERRIAVKVEFSPPDERERLEIWRRLIPRKLPLAGDVDVAGLASRELTGGEIKNVVLNAARIALARDPRGRVTAADFERAMAMEREGRWTAGRRMGFVTDDRAGG
jgi:hypothetical protein